MSLICPQNQKPCTCFVKKRWARGDQMARNVFRVMHLLVCGAVLGLYAARALGFVGVEVTPDIETAGVSAGAIAVGLLKVLHFV